MKQLCSLLVLLAIPLAAHANVGRPTWGGDPAGEPIGMIDVAIEREELVIDLRAVEQRDGLASVSATYHLANRGDAKSLDLVFASGADMRDFRVTLDGAAIATRFGALATLPDSWQPPNNTPLPGGGVIGYSLEPDRKRMRGSASFTLAIPPGKHVLAVAYHADPLHHHGGLPVIAHQLAYVLSPARTWAGFGGLAVTIHVPASWEAAVAPDMPRDGDTFTATFASIPADAIGITVHAPTTLFTVLRIAGIILLVLATFGGGALVARIAYRRERRRAAEGKLPAPGLAALGYACAWAGSVVGAGVVAVVLPGVVLGDQASRYGYAIAFAILLLVPFVILIFIVGLVIGFRSGHRGYVAGVPAPALPQCS